LQKAGPDITAIESGGTNGVVSKGGRKRSKGHGGEIAIRSDGVDAYRGRWSELVLLGGEGVSRRVAPCV